MNRVRIQPSSAPGEVDNLQHFQANLHTGKRESIRYDVVNDVMYIDVQTVHPDGFSAQEEFVIRPTNTDQFSMQVRRDTVKERQEIKERYEADMQQITGVPKEIEKDVNEVQEETVSDSQPNPNREPHSSMFGNEQRPQQQESAGQQEQQNIVPVQQQEMFFTKDFVISNQVISNTRMLFSVLKPILNKVEDEASKEIGLNMIREIERTYYENGLSDYNPDAE